MDIKKTPLPFQVTLLPSPVLTESWGRIIVPPAVKARLLKFIDVGVSLNQSTAAIGLALCRSMLFCGPPGVGKSWLAKAGPNQWACVRNRPCQLLHVNSHLIPSGEHGGTQRNTAHLFERISDYAAVNPEYTTFVTIDEVETLATSRARVNSINNPADTVRGVNAFLEGLDRTVAASPNVFFLLTTNLHAHIDRAITERVDFTQLIRLPDAESRTLILQDAIRELGPLADIAFGTNGDRRVMVTQRSWRTLLNLTDGFSPRALRHLLVSALTFVPGNNPLQMEHLLSAAREEASQASHHRKNGGMYSHDYENTPNSERSLP